MKLSLTFISLTLLLLSFPLSGKALIAPQIYLTGIELGYDSEKIFYPGDRISGSVQIWNQEELIIPDLKIRLELIDSSKLISLQDTNEIFTISGQKEINRSFYYIIPPHTPSGYLKLRIQVINSRGEELTWIDKSIQVNNLNEFIPIDNYGFLVDGEIVFPGSGPIYQANQSPQVFFDVHHQYDQEIVVRPVVRIHRYSIGLFIEEIIHEPIILLPGEINTNTLLLPTITQPGSYLAELSIYDVETNQPISNMALYRWIVSGSSARIISILANQDIYQRDDEAIIRIQLAGSADYNTPLEQGNVRVTLYDINNKIIGQDQKTNINLISGQELEFNIPIREEVLNPLISVIVSSNDTTLDKYSINPGNPSPQTNQTIKDWWQNNQKGLLLLIVTLFSLLTLAFYRNSIKEKNDQNKKTKFLILCSILFFLTISIISTEAAVEINSGCCDTYLQFVSPAPPSPSKTTYLPGEDIRFIGRLSATQSNSSLSHNKISFYITEDKDIPIIDCCGQSEDYCSTRINCLCPEGCQYAYGANSSNYSSLEIRDALWCDQAKNLSLYSPDSRFINPIYKLGEIYPDDRILTPKPYGVEYDQLFSIPENLSFSGPVRFYVIYSGMHGSDHWHWNISYQEGYILRKPSIQGTKEDYDYVNAPLQPILSWIYSSPNNHTQSDYQVVIDRRPDFSDPIIETNPIYSSVNSYSVPADSLTWHTRYYWKVRVQDSHQLWSEWSDVASFVTLKHPYPSVEFEWTPKPIHAQLKILFVDQSISYGNSHIVSYHWRFLDRKINEIIADSQQKNPEISFKDKGYISATLTVVDSSGYSTSFTKKFEVHYPLSNESDILPSPF